MSHQPAKTGKPSIKIYNSIIKKCRTQLHPLMESKLLFNFSLIHMPDLVQNHSVSLSVSPSPLLSMERQVHGRNGIQNTLGTARREDFRGHAMDGNTSCQLSSPYLDAACNRSHVDMASHTGIPHSSNEMTGKLNCNISLI